MPALIKTLRPAKTFLCLTFCDKLMPEKSSLAKLRAELEKTCDVEIPEEQVIFFDNEPDSLLPAIDVLEEYDSKQDSKLPSVDSSFRIPETSLSTQEKQ